MALQEYSNSRGLGSPGATVQHNSFNAENVTTTYNQSLMHTISGATRDGHNVHVLVQQLVYWGCVFCRVNLVTAILSFHVNAARVTKLCPRCSLYFPK